MMIFAVESKRCVAGAGILEIIINKPCHKKKLCSIILFKVDKSLKVGFHYAVLPLNLAICLKMEGN